MRHFLLAAFVALAPAIANAVPISAGQVLPQAGTLQPGGSLTFTIEPTSVLDLSFSASGTGALVDLQNITWTINGGPPAGFTIFGGSPTLAAADGFPPPITTAAPVVFEFMDGVNAPVGLTLTAVAAQIPLPAAGFLMIGALAGLGLVARRRAVKA